MAKFDVYEEVTRRILDKLSKGVVPWKKPWKAGVTGSNVPKNAATNRAYSGVNTLLLWMTAEDRGYTDNRWLTYNQAVDLKGNVKKGEKGTQIIYVNFIDKEDEKTGKPKKIPFARFFTVFNVSQTEGIDWTGEIKIKDINKDQRNDLIDQFLMGTGADIRYGDNRAYYAGGKGLDYINLPNFTNFKSADDFYSTAMHELTHWTGAEHRLAREFGKRFGDQAYSAEELVAELGASFLCAEFAIDNTDSNAGYIAHWIKFLSDHPKAIVTAASAASKAVDYLRDLSLAENDKTMKIAA